MNNLYRLIITLLPVILILPISAISQTASADSIEKRSTYLDSLNVGNELIVDFETSTSPVETTEKVEKVETKPLSQTKVTRSVIPNGFRIQILASSSVDAVREKKEELEEVVLLPMYISFKSPYYKLLAGNFTDRESAEKALVRIKDQGLTDAWIISSEVFKKD